MPAGSSPTGADNFVILDRHGNPWPYGHDTIYDILVAECGAPDNERDRFEFSVGFPKCVEWRFCGRLGFGGKVWWARGELFVSCYPEDATPERDAMVAAANERLAQIVSFDVVAHDHGRGPHTHAHGSHRHSHMLRAICARPECAGCATHDIHAAPAT